MKIDLYKIFYWTFLGIIGLIVISLIVSVLPIPGNIKVMTVLSGSMEPTLRAGSIVVVKPVSDYKIGDIITFGPYSKTKPPVSHRIYDIKIMEDQSFYITKGDANNAPDQNEVRKSNVLGKVLFSVPLIGYAIEAARTPYGFMAIIIIPTLLIIFDEASKIKKELNDEKLKKNGNSKHLNSKKLNLKTKNEDKTIKKSTDK